MKTGIGIRPELFDSVFTERPEFGFLEAHSENYFGESISRAKLIELRESYSVSLHGVGLSLGRADDLNAEHLAQLKSLVDEIDPMLVSEHLAWSAYSHRHVPDLLPLPLTDGALASMCEHVDQMQNILGRQILVENPSNYLLFDQLEIPEPEFLNALAERTGCGLLVDINNIHVSATNIQRDGLEYINALNSNVIGQYHLAGYTEVTREVQGITESVLIDTHNQTVYDPVWRLFEHTIQQHGHRPTLFEWDSDFPEFSVLLEECEKADKIIASNPSKQSIAAQKFEKAKPQANGASQGLEQYQAKFLDGVFSLEENLPTAIEDHQHRLWIYQNNVYAATQDYLQEVYPAVLGVMGKDFFKQVAQHHIQSMPPSQGNIHLYGGQLSNAFEQFEGLQDLNYLYDLSEYEWAVHSAYFAKVSEPIDPATVAQDELLTLAVRFNDSVTLIDSSYPIYEIHRQSLPSYSGDVSIDLNQSQDNLLVYKDGFSVQTKVLNQDELLFYKTIKKSENLLQAIEGVSGSILPDTLSSLLGLVFTDQLLESKPQ